MLKLDARLWAEVSFSSGPRALRADTLRETLIPNEQVIWLAEFCD
jgi:hypothetical protein